MDIKELYHTLLDHFGYQNWWPVDLEYHKKHHLDPKDEVIIGAILTQNTSWKNVEKALSNLKNNNALSLKAIKHMDIGLLKELIRPSGFFNRKAEILKQISTMDKKPSRDELLSIKGIGKETADSILLYAYHEPFFVIDAYTKRIVFRLFGYEFNEYDEYASFISSHIEKNVDIYKEFHALIVAFAKNYCKKTPDCNRCILKDRCLQNLYQHKS
jgi:endonuclease-3 related protein